MTCISMAGNPLADLKWFAGDAELNNAVAVKGEDGDYSKSDLTITVNRYVIECIFNTKRVLKRSLAVWHQHSLKIFFGICNHKVISYLLNCKNVQFELHFSKKLYKKLDHLYFIFLVKLRNI